MMRRCNGIIGFTLIELMVTLAIIGVLAELVLGGLSRAKTVAHSTACKNRLHQLGIALQLYVNDHKSRFPYYHGSPDPSLDGSVGEANTAFWSAKLFPYHSIKWIDPAYHCPAYKGRIEGSKVDRSGFTFPYGSYAYNAMGVRLGWGTTLGETNKTLLGLGARSIQSSSPRSVSGTKSEGQIAVPSEMFAIGESRASKEGFVELWGGVDLMQCGLPKVNAGAMAFDPKRHGENYNQLFCDGHVSAMSPWFIFDPAKSAAMWNYDHQPHPEAWVRSL